MRQRTVNGCFGKYAAKRSLGPVIYALRLDDGVIKIGFTTDLSDREITVRRQSGSEHSEVLAFRLMGTYEDEQDIHAGLISHRAYGWEYYHPTPEVLDVVNAMRADIGLPRLAA